MLEVGKHMIWDGIIVLISLHLIYSLSGFVLYFFQIHSFQFGDFLAQIKYEKKPGLRISHHRASSHQQHKTTNTRHPNPASYPTKSERNHHSRSMLSAPPMANPRTMLDLFSSARYTLHKAYAVETRFHLA